MADYKLISAIKTFVGASTDTKPSSAPTGSKCYEHDTGKWFITYDAGTHWTEITDPTLAAIKAVTDNLPDSGALNDLASIKAVTDNLPDSGALSDLATVKTQTDKLNGELETQSATTANWQSGTATSGETGADLCTIGSDAVRKKLLSFLIRITNLTDTANITVKMFMQVNGTEEKVYTKSFVKGTDPNGLWIVSSAVGIHRAIRVEVQSDNAGDNGKSIGYDFMTEVM